MRHALLLASVAAAIVAAPSMAATSFDGTYSVSANSTDSGLQITTQKIAQVLDFDLNVGQSTTFNLFRISTPESTVNADDLAHSAISVALSFTNPSSFMGSVTGDTFGTATLFGAFQQGNLVWNNGGNQTLTWGNGGKLDVHLSDVTFNDGLFGLGSDKGVVKSTFTYTAAAAVPEPATWAMMVGGFGLLGATMRSRKTRSAIQGVMA